MKIERRASLEKPNVTVEIVRAGRRAKLRREANAKSAFVEHRGRDDGMYAEERSVNTGEPRRRRAKRGKNQ
jgi:hypothetical protein